MNTDEIIEVLEYCAVQVQMDSLSPEYDCLPDHNIVIKGWSLNTGWRIVLKPFEIPHQSLSRGCRHADEILVFLLRYIPPLWISEWKERVIPMRSKLSDLLRFSMVFICYTSGQRNAWNKYNWDSIRLEFNRKSVSHWSHLLCDFVSGFCFSEEKSKNKKRKLHLNREKSQS